VDRDTVFTLCLAALTIVALGAAAATVETADTLGGGEGGSGLGSGSAEDRTGSGPGAGPLPPGDFTGGIDPICFPVLREPPVLGAMGLALAGGVAAAHRYFGDRLSTAVVSGVVALPVIFLWSLLAYCGDPSGETVNAPGADVAIETANETWLPFFGGGSGESGGAVVSAPSAVAFLLAGIALTGAVVVLLASRGDDTVEIDTGGDAPDARSAPDVSAVARAAGRAADRIDGDAAVENEVFRAWAAMTDALDLESPETATPARFEAAAVDAGMDPDDVAELRGLFEAVRYGNRTPNADREQRAIAALRRVEDEYGDLSASADEDGEGR
jgi:hypothetical protein